MYELKVNFQPPPPFTHHLGISPLPQHIRRSLGKLFRRYAKFMELKMRDGVSETTSEMCSENLRTSAKMYFYKTLSSYQEISGGLVLVCYFLILSLSAVKLYT